MSSNLPLRTIRIPALRPQQCLFQHRRVPQAPRAFSTSSPQAFAATCLRQRKVSTLGRPSKSIQKAAASGQMGPAPRVSESQMQQEGGMAEDIGLLQDTIIRPRLRELPSVMSWSFYSLMWKLIKSKGTGLYGRVMYNRCLHKSGKEYWLPIDRNNRGYFKHLVVQQYKNIYTSFAKGDMSTVSRYLMPPIHKSFTSRIARRKNIHLDWKLLSAPKCKIMSHRASVLGDDAPDSAYRQLVMRITSTQSVSIKSIDAGKTDGAYYGSGKPETVVEYMVIQRRVINGREDKDWKIWGFTKESTQKQLREDEQYWKETVNASAA